MDRRRTLFHAVGLSASVVLPATALGQDWPVVEGILLERCVVCHSGEAAPLGLALDSHAALLAGSENGTIVRPDAPPADSPLVRRLRGLDEPRMPLDGPPFLTEPQIVAVEDWIAAGAPGPDPRTEPVPAAAPPDPYADGMVTYNEVAAIFGRHCVECHSANSKLGSPPEDLRLDALAQILAGGERLALIPGNAQASEIVRRVEGLADPRMPLDGPPWLAAEEIRLLRDWIDGGAHDAAGQQAPIPVGAEVRLRGLLTAPAEIDGAAFSVTGATRIDDRPHVGEDAEVRGRIGTNGEIIAGRLRAR